MRSARRGKTANGPSAKRRPPALIVGIGASAGGLAAFKGFFSNMPADTGMTFVLVQHLDPSHKSMLVDLLASQTTMPVAEAQDGVEVEANHIYVIPPNATLTFDDGALRVSKPAPPRETRRPIDTFFASLADNHEDCAVGIILSGVGSDGTLGVRAIKEHGGFTLAEAEYDSKAKSGMPGSAVATGLVDHVLSVADMPKKLIEYQGHLNRVENQKGADGTRADAREHLATITALLRNRVDHDFSGYKEKTLIRRIQRRMQVLQIPSFSDYAEHLRREPQEGQALFRELLIGVTQFFRDPDAFEALKKTVVLPLLASKKNGDPIRVWVPGCATGEEVYSIAILLREAMGQHKTAEVTIFGTDIDADAVAFARAARYRKGLVDLSTERLERWFTKDGEDHCPIATVRDMCVFSVHSIVKDPPFSKLDLISCRNVLIYLDSDFQHRAMQAFHYALRPGGYLFLGTSESASREAHLFSVLDKKHRILHRRDSARPTLPEFRPAAAVPTAAAASSARGEDRLAKSAGRAMEKYSPAYFVIDRNYEILRFSGSETAPYLEPSTGAASLNLFAILRKSLRTEVRAGVQQAFAANKTAITDNLTVRIDGHVRPVTLIVEPIAESGAELCIVAFRERDQAPLTSAKDGPAGAPEDVEPLRQELRATKAQLQTTVDELESHIEEMRSSTEEYQSVNEELQSANEELETSKEEMQSVNEELQTINTELTSKNEQLTQLNSDVQNLLDSTQIATIFLDDDLRIRNFTPATTDLFPLREADRGRSITEIITHLTYDALRADVTKVQRTLAIVEREVTLKNESASFVMRIRPYRTVKNLIDGVVITFVDITERKRQGDKLNVVMREMLHRTNNLLTVIQAMARQTARHSTNFEDFATRFDARIRALAHSNHLLVKQDWQGATVEDLVHTQLTPFIEDDKTRLDAKGPHTILKPEAAQAVGLALHELGTNASKYGALSRSEGKIAVHWEIYTTETATRWLRLTWHEHGGPPVKPPKRKGFGSVVIEEMVKRTLGAQVSVDFATEGARWTMEIPADHVLSSE